MHDILQRLQSRLAQLRAFQGDLTCAQSLWAGPCPLRGLVPRFIAQSRTPGIRSAGHRSCVREPMPERLCEAALASACRLLGSLLQRTPPL